MLWFDRVFGVSIRRKKSTVDCRKARAKVRYLLLLRSTRRHRDCRATRKADKNIAVCLCGVCRTTCNTPGRPRAITESGRGGSLTYELSAPVCVAALMQQLTPHLHTSERRINSCCSCDVAMPAALPRLQPCNAMALMLVGLLS